MFDLRTCACPGCRKRFQPRSPSHRFCSPGCRIEGDKPRRAERYDETHRRLRRQVGYVVEAGGALCTRCGLPIKRGEEWHLDHEDDGHGYRGPSHASCNIAAALERPRELTYEHDPSAWEDDPVNGIFWGPDGRRWSRAWYEWRRPSSSSRG